MTRIETRVVSARAVLVLATLSAAIPAYAQTYSVLYDFGNRSGDPLSPVAGLTQGEDGALYGTSEFGGASAVGGGTVFKITPAGEMRVLYSFCSQSNCADGQYPIGGLTLRPDGHFLGTTAGGGNSGNGTIFDITQSGELTKLYDFTGKLDGSAPEAPPITGPDGSFYGTTSVQGASSNCGTVYKIAGPGTGGFKLLDDFSSPGGCTPIAPVVLGADANLYGTTAAGGGAGVGNGVIFQMTPAGVLNLLYFFSGGTDGALPLAALVQANDGNFYGTTFGSPLLTIPASVFKMTRTGTFKTLHTLNGTTDGANVRAGLVEATDGNFYGAAGQGGTSTNCNNGCGTLYRVTTNGSYSVLHNFDGTQGSDASGTPFQHTNGELYGVTFGGGTGSNVSCGTGGCGVLYSWNAGLPAFVNLVPYAGKVGSTVGFLGQGFTSSTTVSFNGTPATATVVSGTYLRTTVPSGATTGFVTVTTTGGTLTSNKQFVVTP
jgi:uncharacterized repeat protein (TIGR03803 family)